MDVGTFLPPGKWCVSSGFSRFNIVHLVLNKTFIDSTASQEFEYWVAFLSRFVSHLRGSSWTLELEHALKLFSLGTVLDKLTQQVGWSHRDCAEEFFDCLEANVRIPSSQINCQLQLIILTRKKLNFITIMPAYTWSMLCLPSIVTQVQRSSTF
jgi:hypothetical protein